MKKIISLFVLLFPLYSLAQIEFNGIRVGESLEITKKKLQDKGFTLKKAKGNHIEWEGSILGKTAEIFSVSTPISKFVWKIIVVPETHTNWSSTKSAVEKYLKILSDKYGEPKNEYYLFKEPYSEGDGNEMMALNLDKILCTYIWELPEGSIMLDLKSFKYGESQIWISYEDDVTSGLRNEESAKLEQSTF
jgi:hypothetical protein